MTNEYQGYHDHQHDPRLDGGRAALIAQLDEALAEIARLKGRYEPESPQ